MLFLEFPQELHDEISFDFNLEDFDSMTKVSKSWRYVFLKYMFKKFRLIGRTHKEFLEKLKVLLSKKELQNALAYVKEAIFTLASWDDEVPSVLEQCDIALKLSNCVSKMAVLDIFHFRFCYEHFDPKAEGILSHNLKLLTIGKLVIDAPDNFAAAVIQACDPTKVKKLVFYGDICSPALELAHNHLLNLTHFKINPEGYGTMWNSKKIPESSIDKTQFWPNKADLVNRISNKLSELESLTIYDLSVKIDCGMEDIEPLLTPLPKLTKLESFIIGFAKEYEVDKANFMFSPWFRPEVPIVMERNRFYFELLDNIAKVHPQIKTIHIQTDLDTYYSTKKEDGSLDKRNKSSGHDYPQSYFLPD